MMKFVFFALFSISSILGAQNLNKMNWFNEPERYSVNKDDSFTIFTTPKTDYWRITHYQFTVDDAPFYYGIYGGEFEVSVKLEGKYKSRFDQMGLMIRQDEKNWIKCGIEYVGNRQNISAVVTHNTSDWSVIELSDSPKFIWIKAIRRLDAIEIFYSLDGEKYTMMRTCFLEANKPVMVGMMSASPDGDGFEAIFHNFKVVHLPDIKRLQWLDKNK